MVEINSNKGLQIRQTGGSLSAPIEPATDYSNDINALVQENAEQAIDIIELQANSTITPIDHDTLLSDTFSDTTGYLNTVNVGNTTSVYNVTNKYYESGFTVVDAESATVGTTSGTGTNRVVECTALTKGYISSVRIENRSAGASNYTLYIRETPGNAILAQKTTNVPAGAVVSLTLTPGDYSRLLDTETFNIYITGAAVTTLVHTFAGSNFSYTSQETWTTASGQGGGNITFTEGDYSIGTVEIDLPSITGTVTDTQLVVNSVNVAEYNITDGVGTDSAQAINTKNTLTNVTSNPTKIQILVPVGVSNYVKTYCLKIWKA